MYTLCRLMLMVAVLAIIYCVAMLAVQFETAAIYFVIGTLVLGLLAKRGYGALTAYGTARWASADDLRKAGMLDARSGLIIGRLADGGKPPLLKSAAGLFSLWVKSKEACERFLDSMRFGTRAKAYPAFVKLSKAVHTAVFAPTGVGKGVSCVIPFLKTCPESVVVVDFKSENAQLTAKHRQRAFGHRIVMLDPFKMGTEKPATLNPLDFIDKDLPTAIDECRDLAEALVVSTGHEHDRHWVESAEAWIGAMIALVVQYGERNDRSLQTVRTLLTNPQKMQMAIELMCQSDAWGGMLSRMGNQLTQYKDKELGGVLTTANRFLRFLDTLPVSASTTTSSFDPAELRKGKMSVYLVLPPEHMRAQSPLLRMWIGSLLRAVIRGGLQEKNKVHFVLDEAASLGHMQALDDAVDKYRGYGIRLIFLLQSLGQLKVGFPDGQDQTLLSNVSQVFFGINDLPTAEYVSNRLGEATIVTRSGGTNSGTSHSSSVSGGSHGTSSGSNDNWQQTGRRLLKPEEVLALPERTAITFTPGVLPIWTTLIRSYEEPRLGRGFGLLAGFKTWLGVFMGSLVVLAGTGCLALVVSQNVKGISLGKQMPVRHEPEFFLPQ